VLGVRFRPPVLVPNTGVGLDGKKVPAEESESFLVKRSVCECLEDEWRMVCDLLDDGEGLDGWRN
jgi:hypothetical protein